MARKSSRSPQEKEDISSFKQIMAQRIPDMLSAALSMYDHITMIDITDDPKLIIATQNAAKATLSHVEHLLKIAEWLPKATGISFSDNHEKDLIAMAREALSRERKEHAQGEKMSPAINKHEREKQSAKKHKINPYRKNHEWRQK